MALFSRSKSVFVDADILVIGGGIAVIITGIVLFSIPARAHDWYPMECCHAMDCAPVDNTAFTQSTGSSALPQLVVTTKHGTAIVPQGFPFLESKDNRMHACMRPGEGGHMRLICIFAPPAIWSSGVWEISAQQAKTPTIMRVPVLSLSAHNGGGDPQDHHGAFRAYREGKRTRPAIATVASGVEETTMIEMREVQLI